jgi:hypothetical protein
VTVLPFELRSLEEMDGLFAAMARAGVQALSLGPGGLIFKGRDSLQRLATAHRIPTCGWSREMLAAGLLLSYGADQVEMARHAPVFVDKICAAPVRLTFRSSSRHASSSSSTGRPPMRSASPSLSPFCCAPTR